VAESLQITFRSLNWTDYSE